MSWSKNATNSTTSVYQHFMGTDPQVHLAVNFLHTRYALCTLFMAFLLDRVQHIVAPVNRLQNPTHLADANRPAPSAAKRTLSNILSYFFPINFSKPWTRFLLRLPTLVLMWRAVAIGCLLLLQINDRLPAWGNDWILNADMKDVCWTAYVATCLTLFVTAMNNGLDGGGSGHTALTFNLVDFSIMMHYLASPKTHTIKPEGLPTRPDIHGLLAMLAPLVDLTVYHTIGINKKWSRARLGPTGIQFFIIGFSYWLDAANGHKSVFAKHIRVATWLDTAMLVAIGVTWTLKATTVLLLQGTLDGSFWALPANMTLRWEDDFRTALLKLIIASFSTTSIMGFANELPSLNSTFQSTVEILPSGQVIVTPSDEDTRRGVKRGLGLEVKKVKAQAPETSDAIFGGLAEAHRWRLLQRLGDTIWVIVAATGRAAWNQRFWKNWFAVKKSKTSDKPQMDGQPQEQEEEDGIYQKFLRGVSIASEEDSDYAPSDNEDEDEDIPHEPHEEDGDEEPESSLSLYESNDAPDAPILLTHLLNNSPQPMTRRRYQGTTAAVSVASPSTPRARPAAAVDAEGKQCCIVCYTEPRVVVCWPCRCLSLCDDCRSSLATLPLSQHLCPTCRTPVEGYSRIFIP